MSVSLFQTLTPLPDQEMLPVHILEQGEILKFKKYESISLDEKNINYIFYIKEGIVSTFRETIEGERKTLHIIGRGYFLFESYYFSQKAVQIRCSGLKNE